jgi:hypothetical protein
MLNMVRIQIPKRIRGPIRIRNKQFCIHNTVLQNTCIEYNTTGLVESTWMVSYSALSCLSLHGKVHVIKYLKGLSHEIDFDNIVKT